MRELTVTSNEAQLYVQVHGSEQKPTILFLHGYPDCHRTWEKQIAYFKQDYQVVCFDMRGAGRSQLNGDNYQIEQLTMDIEAVINAVVGKSGQVHLVGHDWGSVIGWSFITEPYYAARVLSYTSMSGPHLGLMLSWARRRLLSRNPRQLLELAKQLGSSWYVGFLNIPKIPELLLKNMGLPIWNFALRNNGVDADDPYLAVNQKELEAFTINPIGLYRQNPLSPPEIPQPKGIKVPVQLIIPTEDRFITDKLFCYYDEYVVDLRKRVIAAKHWAHHSHAHEFNRWVGQFIQGIEQEKDKRVA